MPVAHGFGQALQIKVDPGIRQPFLGSLRLCDRINQGDWEGNLSVEIFEPCGRTRNRECAILPGADGRDDEVGRMARLNPSACDFSQAARLRKGVIGATLITAAVLADARQREGMQGRIFAERV
jgi:hypothetical protein